MLKNLQHLRKLLIWAAAIVDLLIGEVLCRRYLGLTLRIDDFLHQSTSLLLLKPLPLLEAVDLRNLGTDLHLDEGVAVLCLRVAHLVLPGRKIWLFWVGHLLHIIIQCQYGGSNR